jgi:fructokinase
MGEILWDVFEDAEFLGGAPLNFSAAAERLGHSVPLITAVGDDQRGHRAIESMQALGLSTEFVQILPGRETGTALITTDSQGNASFFIQRPAVFDAILVDEARLTTIAQVRPDWLYFGTLAPFHPPTEELLHRILDRLPDVQCFYDLNLRQGHWELALVERLSDLASIVKLNESEAETLFRLTQAGQEFSLEGFCRHWSSAHAVEMICVTLGERGCAIFETNVFQQFDGYAVRVVDTVGAGDAFAAAFLHGHELGWPTARAAAFANALGAQVASRAGATPAWTVDECWEMVALQSPTAVTDPTRMNE